MYEFNADKADAQPEKKYPDVITLESALTDLSILRQIPVNLD